MDKNSPAVTHLQIETCMRFIGAACIAKGMMGGEQMIGNPNFAEAFVTYSKIGSPIIAKLIGDASKKGDLIEVCSTGQGLRDFVLETAREVIKLLEHA